MTSKFTTLTHKIVVQLHLVAESYTINISCSWQPVRKRLDKPSFMEQSPYWEAPSHSGSQEILGYHQ